MGPGPNLTLGLDFSGREYSDGRILLAGEVDVLRWRKPRSSILKLCDVRAKNKILILVGPSGKEEVYTYFYEIVEDAKHLIQARQEKKKAFGEFLVVMKTPDDFRIRDIFGEL